MSAVSSWQPWPGRASVRVRYGETDQMGVVHHKVYLDYFEVARTELLRDHGLPYGELEKGGHFLPVVEVRVSYKAPAHYDELLEVQCRIARVRGAGFEVAYRLMRPGAGTVLALGTTTLACVDREGRVRRLPGELRSLLLQLVSEEEV